MSQGESREVKGSQGELRCVKGSQVELSVSCPFVNLWFFELPRQLKIVMARHIIQVISIQNKRERLIRILGISLYPKSKKG